MHKHRTNLVGDLKLEKPMRNSSSAFKRSLSAAAAAAVLLAVPFGSQAASLGFSLTIDDITNSVTSSLAGVTVTALGTQRWSLDFSGSAITALETFSDSANLSWVSGADDTGVNWLRYQSGSTYLLDGDTTNPAALAGNCGIPAPLAQGVTCFIGNSSSDSYFVTVIDRTPSAVPVPATLALAGLVLLAAAAASRRRS
jgi:hypothetical protein